MKKMTSRAMALLLVLTLCLGLIIPVNAATVSYVTGSADGFTGVIRNWGTRGQEADFLSPNAIDFYEDNNTSYSELAKLSGSSTQSSVPSSALYNELQDLMADNHTKLTSYGNIRYLFAFTDCEKNSTSTLSEFYLGTTIGSAWDGGTTFNREHCWPKSKTSTPTVNNNTKGEAADIMSQRPADPGTNSGRSNDAYGIGSSYFDPNCKQKYGDNVRGDVARIILYVYVRWGNTSNMWGSSGVMQNKDVLLDWMEEDPVDTWEMGRNDSVESITGTRNVFVDYPELAFKLFNESVPSGYSTPSGGEDGGSSGTNTIKASTNNGSWGTVSVSGNTIIASPASGYEVSSYTILTGTATVTQNGNRFTVVNTGDVSIRINFAKKDPVLSPSTNNSSWGTVVVDGKNIIATPAAGYIANSYTILSGDATVVQDGNTFKVTFTSDVSIRINFATIKDYTVTFKQNGTTVSTQTQTSQSIVTMPAHSGTVPTDYSFVGWTTEQVTESATAPAVIYQTGDPYTVTSNQTFHALYGQWEEGGTGNAFVLHTGEITDGEYLLTHNDGALTASINSGTRFDYTDITVFENAVSATDAAIIWRIEKQADGYYTIYNEESGKYAAGTGAKNKGAMITSITDYAKWTVTGTETYEFKNLGNSIKGVNDLLRRNGTYGFACYSSSTGGSLTLYKRGTGSAIYTTSPKVPIPTYTVTFLGADGTVISSEVYQQGATVAVPQAPAKAADKIYTYAFAGWTPTVTTVTGNATYRATYTATYIPYTVTFLDEDGSLLAKQTYVYGAEVVAPQAPAKAEDENYTYEFVGWTPSITAVTGNATYTATYTATEKAPVVENTIVAQPQAVTAESGETVQFHVAVEGEVVAYKWEYRKISKWFNTSMEGFDTATLTVPATGARNGYDYRCTVTFADGTVLTTEPAELTVITHITDVQNPNDQTVVNGYKGQFTVAATGEGLKYRWYFQRPDGTIWSETAMEGCEKPTVYIESTAARDGYKYRCKITDVTGNVVYSEVATMRVLSFKSHPAETYAANGTNVTFTVTTSVDSGFTYQWQYRRNATANWTNTTMEGYNTATLTVGATNARDGYEYRCVLTGSKNSKLESKSAVLHVGDPVVINEQPESTTVAVGETAVFTVKATNVGSYQWMYTSNGTTWFTTSATGNQTPTLQIVAKARNNGYQYRCHLYGLDGTEIVTDVVTLTVK